MNANHVNVFVKTPEMSKKFGDLKHKHAHLDGNKQHRRTWWRLETKKEVEVDERKVCHEVESGEPLAILPQVKGIFTTTSCPDS
jgi:hypothetical protein